MKDGLTILITTYNREQRLVNMLHSIERQKRWGEYSILIVDNCSPDYCWDRILCEFSPDFCKNLSIHRRNFNCGMSSNITSCFLLPDTEWVLLLSDDDEMIDGSLETVLNDCSRYKDSCGLIKYTIQSFTPYSDIEISTIEDYISVYKSHPCADSVFLTGLYNMKVIGDNMGLATTWAYTYIGFLIPLLKGLETQQYSIVFSSQSIIKYIKPEKCTEWKKLPVLLGFASIFDFYLNIDEKTFRALYAIPVSNLSMGLALRAISECNYQRWYKLYLFDKLYYSLYKPIYGGKAYSFKLASFIYRYLHINPIFFLDLRRLIH